MPLAVPDEGSAEAVVADSTASTVAASTLAEQVVTFGYNSFTPDEAGRRNFMTFLFHFPEKFEDVFSASLVTDEYVKLGALKVIAIIDCDICDKGSYGSSNVFASACSGEPDTAGCRLKDARLA